MDNKYYTPTIDEFYVGFECERKEDDIWKPYTITLSSWSSNALWLMLRDDPSSFRVKYLDEEDIESLGFIKDNDIYKLTRYDFTWTLKFTFKVIKNIKNKEIIITNTVIKKSLINSITQEFSIIFNGEIKNKSELIKLLKQLNI